MSKNNVIGRYLELSMKQAADGIDYHVEGEQVLGYAFGVPIYDLQDFLDWSVESSRLIEKRMNSIGQILREGIGVTL